MFVSVIFVVIFRFSFMFKKKVLLAAASACCFDKMLCMYVWWIIFRYILYFPWRCMCSTLSVCVCVEQWWGYCVRVIFYFFDMKFKYFSIQQEDNFQSQKLEHIFWFFIISSTKYRIKRKKNMEKFLRKLKTKIKKIIEKSASIY